MNIFGIGPSELAIILLLMLIVAGPKRMAQWAYVMGQYMAKMRVMWQETSLILKKELEDAGIEPEVVDTFGQLANPRTRNAVISKPLDKLVDDMKKPITESLAPVEEAMKEMGTTRLDLSSQPEAETNAEGRTEQETVSSESPKSTPGQYDAWTPS
jgi:Sec-independent protein translocase protein TatA